jgi:4-amino-4-deoxy-L-arabinose transferase-like glycosyltransferase
MLALLKRVLRSPWVMVAAALLVRLGVMALQRTYIISAELDHYSFGFETGRVARAIAAGEGFSSPLHGQTGPTAWHMPVYPYLLAGIFKLFGIYSTASAVVAIALNCIFSALTCLPIYHIGRKTLGEGVALGAAWAWVVYYQAIHLSTTWIWDTSLTTLLVSCLVVLSLELHRKESQMAWAGFGMLCGFAALASASVFAVLPALGIWIAWRRARVGAWVLPCGVAAAAFLLTLAPWAARNYAVLGEWVFPRSNLGLELYLGTVEDRPGVGFYWMHPSNNEAELAKYSALGELAYMKEKRRLALEAIASDPGTFWTRTLQRIELCWLGPWHITVANWQAGRFGIGKKLLLTTFVTLLAACGLWFVVRERRGEPMLFGILLLFYPLIYYFTHDAARYRHPIDPLVILLAVNGAARLTGWGQGATKNA